MSSISLIVGLVLLQSTRHNLSKTAIRLSDKYHKDSELPSVSVCIPARNETRDLSACLESILSNDYPKLEVLVLDDCSQDKTSEIIKGFAQKGVRFIKGEPPQGEWLAKNQAYQTLAEAASGEMLIFCGVDTRFGTQTIKTLIASMISRKKQMVSVLPRALDSNIDEDFLQPMRYWWELALPRRILNRPPVLSTVWAITRHSFFNNGELKSVKNSVIPEGYFARELAKTDEYSFMRSSGKLHINSVKQVAEQLQTAIRTKYPSLRKRPENVFLLALFQIWFLLLPICLFISGYFIDLGFIWLIAGINTIVLFFVHRGILSVWNDKKISLALALLPVAIIVDIAVLFRSMWNYEFSEVSWKDRNICIPVMHQYPKLPKV